MRPSATRSTIEDRLIKVDDGYYRFAEENGWDGAGASLGRSLWDFVAGHDVKKLQRLLLRRVREGVRDVELPFRCDGPDVTREMDIRIAADSTGRVVLFSARLRAEEEREEPQPLLRSGRARATTTTSCRCAPGATASWSTASGSRSRRRRSGWSSSGAAELPALDHGICPQCSGQLLAA